MNPRKNIYRHELVNFNKNIGNSFNINNQVVR